MYGQTCCSANRTTMPGAAGMCCCRSWTLMPFLRDVDNLVIALDAARDAALARCTLWCCLCLVALDCRACISPSDVLTCVVSPCCFAAAAQGVNAAALR